MDQATLRGCKVIRSMSCANLQRKQLFLTATDEDRAIDRDAKRICVLERGGRNETNDAKVVTFTDACSVRTIDERRSFRAFNTVPRGKRFPRAHFSAGRRRLQFNRTMSQPCFRKTVEFPDEFSYRLNWINSVKSDDLALLGRRESFHP